VRVLLHGASTADVFMDYLEGARVVKHEGMALLEPDVYGCTSFFTTGNKDHAKCWKSA
jgi:hypothetical protein